jgi:ribosomal protein S28E/S33
MACLSRANVLIIRESTRGVGSPIGQFNGPTRGSFQDKVECYKCWRTGSLTDVPTIRSRADASPISNRAIPCGFVRTAAGDILSLKETSRNRTRLQGFSINGQYYTPVSFHVSEICSCRFYRLVLQQLGCFRRLGRSLFNFQESYEVIQCILSRTDD